MRSGRSRRRCVRAMSPSWSASCIPSCSPSGPDGQLVDRAADLDAHRSGHFTIGELSEEEVRVVVAGDTAMTFVVLRVAGTIGDAEVSGRMRYTRTWTRGDGAWRVLGAHIAPAGG